MKDYILGVDLGGTNIKAAAYRLESYEKVGEKRLPTQVEGGWEHVLGRVLAALEEAARNHTGVCTLDGGMVDKPMELRARTTLAKARAAGIIKTGGEGV